MNLDDMYSKDAENNTEENERKGFLIKTKRSARLTLGHLLKLRSVRENKKIEKKKDLELYYHMYGGGGGGDDVGGF